MLVALNNKVTEMKKYMDMNKRLGDKEYISDLEDRVMQIAQ